MVNAKNNRCSVLLALFCVFLQTYVSPAIKIDIVPRKYTGDDQKDVKIYCTLDEAESAAREIMLLKVSRKGERAIAMVHPNSSISYHAGNTDEFLATGKIDKTISKTYMTLVIKTPETEDTGTYTCNIFYMDAVGVLVENKASGYLSVDDPDVKQLKETMKALVQKVAQGESDVKGLKTMQAQTTNKINLIDSNVSSVYNDMANVTDSVDGYKLRITELTNKVDKQAGDIKQLLDKEAIYKEMIANMSNTVEKQAAQIENVTDKENQLGDDLEALRTSEAQLAQQVTQLINDSKNASTSASTSSPNPGNAVPVIVFSATNQNMYIDARVGQVPIFPDVILNEGKGYDPKTGTFTAPVDGIYVFNLVIKLNCHACYVQVELLANNALMMKLNIGAKDDALQNSASAITKLNKGDIVKPYTDSATANSLFTINRLSMFSGYIVNID